MNVNNIILDLMKAKGVSQSQLAEKINIAQPNLNRLLKGNDIKVSVLIDIAKALEVNPAYLINPDLEGLMEHYRNLTESLLEVIIGLVNDYTEFVNTLEFICFKNPKLKQELNKCLFEYYTLRIKESKKQGEKAFSKLPEKSKRLRETLQGKSIVNLDKETIKKDTIKNILINLEKNMAQSASLFEIIAFEDEKFDTTSIEILYDLYIHSKH